MQPTEQTGIFGQLCDTVCICGTGSCMYVTTGSNLPGVWLQKACVIITYFYLVTLVTECQPVA